MKKKWLYIILSSITILSILNLPTTEALVTLTPPKSPACVHCIPSQIKIITHARADTQVFIAQLNAYSASNNIEVANKVFESADQLQVSLTQLTQELNELWPTLNDEEKTAIETFYIDFVSYLSILTEEATNIFSSKNSIIKAEFELIIRQTEGIPFEEVSINYVEIKW